MYHHGHKIWKFWALSVCVAEKGGWDLFLSMYSLMWCWGGGGCAGDADDFFFWGGWECDWDVL